jgi:hypothetical protein
MPVFIQGYSMRSLLISSIIVCLFTFMAPAQPDSSAYENIAAQPIAAGVEPEISPISFSARIGYGLRIGGSSYVGSVEGETKIYGTDGELIENKDHYLNYGQGLKAELAGNIELMRHVGAEVILAYTGNIPRTIIKHDSPTDKWKETWRQASFGVKVMAVPRFRIIELIDMDLGFGAGIFFTRLSFTDNSPAAVNDGYIKTWPGIAFCGRIGAEFPLSESFAITAALSTETVAYTIKERRETRSSLVYQSDSNRGSLSSNVERPEKIPGSNLALQLGARISIF